MGGRRSSTAGGDGRAVVLGLGGPVRDEPGEILMRTAFAEELDEQGATVDGLSLTDLAHTVTLTERRVVPAADWD